MYVLKQLFFIFLLNVEIFKDSIFCYLIKNEHDFLKPFIFNIRTIIIYFEIFFDIIIQTKILCS